MSGARRIAVVTTSRADYGIYRPLLRTLATDPTVSLLILASGSHLMRDHGYTLDAIEADGFTVSDRIELALSSDASEAIARAMGLATQGFARSYARLAPEIVLVLGDRYEMHAAAVAASPFRIGLAHLHGGELSLGARDDAWRHSITKLAHIHFVATEDAARRVRQLGEEAWRVHRVGALGLDNLDAIDTTVAADLSQRIGLDLSVAPLLVTVHPETIGAEEDFTAAPLVAVLKRHRGPIIITAPNADAGNAGLRRELQAFAEGHDNVRYIASLGTDAYFALLRGAAAMIGNSSSGLIEAPSFALPVVNIGRRQDGRVRGRNVIDCANTESAIADALARALDPGFRATLKGACNPYWAGKPAAAQIANVLRETRVDAHLLRKSFVDTPAA